MPISRTITLLTFAWIGLAPTPGHAQWWTAAPADFEDCAERAARSSGGKDARDSALVNCESKFAGRRKPGGGYTYYDFMQNRSFDLAGPNPTAAEQKAIDEQYTSYLDHHRRSAIAAALAEKQRQVQQASLEIDAPLATAAISAEPTPLPVARPKPRPKISTCAADPLSCGWSKLSSGIKDITSALFGPSTAKARRT